MATRKKTEEPIDDNEHVVVAAETLCKDLVNMTLTEIKVLPIVWQRLGENEQQDVIDRLVKQTQSAVSQAINILVAEKRLKVPVTINKANVDKAIKVEIVAPRNDVNRHDLLDSVGDTATLVLAVDDQQYKQGLEGIRATPNQSDIFDDARDATNVLAGPDEQD